MRKKKTSDSPIPQSRDAAPETANAETPVDRDEEDAQRLREQARGMPYADDPAPVFWQTSQQEEYIKQAYLAAQNKAPDKEQTKDAPAGGKPSDNTPPDATHAAPAFETPQAASAATETARTLEAIGKAAPMTTGAKVRLFAERAAHFLRARRERREMASVPDQKREKKRQNRNLLAACAVALAVVAALVYIGDKARPKEKVVVQTYKSDFSVAPSGADKQAFQAAYEARVRVLEDRLRVLQSELALVSGRVDKSGTGGKTGSTPTVPAVAVADLPDLEESLAREAQALSSAGTAPNPAAPRMAVVRVADVGSAAISKPAAPVRPLRRLVADIPIAANRARLEEENTYLPAGSFAQAVVLSGVTAATGGMAANNPVPLLMQVTDMAQLPNRFRANVKRCFLTGSATGDLSSERVWIRLDRLSCMRTNGKAIDVRVQGYA
ncbi:MAG: TrbI/VirB10 family protein, partial [Duodenibacillus sp.]